MENCTLRVEGFEKVPQNRPIIDVALDEAYYVSGFSRQEGEVFAHVYHGCSS